MPMHLVCCQHDIAWEDKARNFERVLRLLAEAKVSPGSLILLPEMFATGFSMNVEAIADPENGEVQAFLAELARAHQSTVIGGVARRAPHLPKGNNRALVISPTGQVLAD